VCSSDLLSVLNLIEYKDGQISLTADGRTYALRIIRIHRLWERYYADETGLSEMEWHKQAELKEHTTSREQAEKLAKDMGHPTFDPHGDPIPTAAGQLPPKTGMSLFALEVGQKARIIHIEDEPAELYAQLVAEGLYPGMVIHLHEKEANKIHFSAEGEEKILAPIVAANITVKPIAPDQEIDLLPSESLADLKTDQSGTVIGISKACRGMQRRRLMDLGIIPGTVIKTELESASGDPVAYNVRGAMIALRNDQARLIKVRLN